MEPSVKPNESQNPERVMTHSRVLCYSPYNLWTLHGMWEMTVLHALKLRGADVQYVLCDGLYAECDVYWAATNPRHAHSCAQCQAHVANLVYGMRMLFEWLGRYVLPGELREARTWANSLDPSDFLTATYGNWRIGEWVEASVHSHFRLSHLDLNVPAIQDGYRNYLNSGLVACFGLSRLLDEYKPDTLFLFNGRQSSTRVALELARHRKLRVVCHERGILRESLTFVENAGIVSLQPIKQLWQDWGDIPLNHAELQVISQCMADRENGKNLGWRSFNPQKQDPDAVRRALELSSNRRLWVLFTSSDDEVVSAGEWAGPFTRQSEWIQRTIAFVRERPDIDLVIRVHPNTAGKRATGSNVAQLREMEYLRSNLSNNIRMVMPEDPISSYSLMDIASLGLVYHSIVGLEMACKGKHVIVAAGSYISDLPFVRTVSTAEAYESMLDDARNLPSATRSLEIQRKAYRVAYGLFFRRNIPFPLVKMPDAHSGTLAYESIDRLSPGCDPSLDRVCRIILDGEPVCPPPGVDDRLRSDQEELEWLKSRTEVTSTASPDLLEEAAPRVSVVIPCFNYAQYLSEAVGSVTAQTYRDFEIIIVNDGSTDNTREVAEQLVCAYSAHRIRVIHQERSGQPAISRNRGISEARGDYILCLDADDMIAPTMLEECVRLLDTNPDVAIAYTDNLYCGDGWRRRVDALEYDFKRLTQANFLAYCSLYHRQAWVDVGGYRTNVKGYEDWDFWIACGERGHVGKRIPQPLFLYRKHDGGLYTNAVTRDQTLKAQIVLNHPALYDQPTRLWAEGVLDGRTGSAHSDEKASSTDAVSSDTAAINAHLQRADERFVAGDLDAARDALLDAIRLAPGDPQLIIAYGNILLRLGDAEGARREFVKATKLAPDHAPGHLNLAAVLLMLGQIQEAETTVRRALELQPADADALKLLGRLCFESGRGSEGITAYTEALRQCPDDVETLLVLGKCAVEAGDWHTAQLTYERVLQIEPNNELARENLDVVKEQMPASAVCQVPTSVSHAPLVSVIVPTFNRPEMLADALRSILNQTFQDFEIIVVNDGGSAVESIVNDLNRDCRITYIRHGKNRNLAAARNSGVKAARGKYVTFLDDDDRYYPEHLETLVTFLEQSAYQVAYTDAHRAFQVKEGNRYIVKTRDVPYSFDFNYDRILVGNFVPVLCFMLERSCLDQVGLFDETLTTHEDWDLWIRISRKFRLAHLKRITCEFASRNDGSSMTSSKLADFLRTYEVIIEKYRNHTENRPDIREAQQRELEIRRRQVVQLRAAAHASDNAMLHTHLQQANERVAVGDLAAAKDCLLKALTIAPDNPELIGALGNVLLRLGDIEAARREFTKTTVLHPEYAPAHADLAAVLLHLGRAGEAESSARQALALEPTNLGALKVLARIYLDSERYAEAVQAYVTILQQNPDDVETLLLVGNCYAEAGRPEDAKAFYRRALALDPGNAVAADNLAAVDGTDPVSGARDLPDVTSEAARTSIIIVTYNSARTIRACLDSIFSATRTPIELIVVDNASTDTTRAVLAEYRDRITALFNSENAGFSRGCNQGIRASTGEYVVLLNPDTVVTAGWLERMLAHISPGVGAVGPVSDYVAGLQKCQLYLPADRPATMTLPELADLLGGVNRRQAVETRLLIGFCLAAPRKVLDEVGLLDEDLFLGNDDLDLSWRLRLRGYRLLVATDAFVHHEGQVSFKSEAETKTSRLVQESTDRLYAKLEAHYGVGNIPSPMELWGIDWFKPTTKTEDRRLKVDARLTSIIILTHNGLEHTKKCLASIEAHTAEPHELIIIENASTDGTLDYLRDYVADHDNVRVVANLTNRGFAAGNNQGLAMARGEFVLLLNNDTVVTEGWLGRMLRLFETHPDVGIVGPVSNYVSGSQLVREASYGSPAELATFAAGWARSHNGQSQGATRVVGFCLLMRKAVLVRIGGLDERFGSGNFEDDDLCIRAFQIGFRARIALDVFIHHTGSQTFKAAKIDYRQSLMRNWELFKAKWGIPADRPYEQGYQFPPQGIHDLSLSVPLPDIGADHRCDSNGRWWREIGEEPGRCEPAITGETRFGTLIIPNGHGIAPVWSSLVQYTNYPLAITIVPSISNGNEGKPPAQPPCPKGWQFTTVDAPAVQLLNRLLQSADDNPAILLSGDLVLTPGWLKRLLEALERDPRIAVVGPAMNHGAPGQRVKADYKGTGKALRQFALRRAHRYGKQLAVTDRLAPSCLVFNPAVCRTVGPLREDLDLAASLADYVTRLRTAGSTVAVALDAYAQCEGTRA